MRALILFNVFIVFSNYNIHIPKVELLYNSFNTEEVRCSITVNVLYNFVRLEG